MATGPGFPSGNNTYVPTDMSGRLRIGFSRDPKKFHLPKYVQYVEAPNMTAYYLKITGQEAARYINAADMEWPDGSPDRAADDGTESFNFVPFTTQRRSYKFRLGDLSTKQAAWPIVEQHSQIKAAQCMTHRTIRMLSAATTTSNWASSIDTANLSANHHGSATAIGGGKFDVGTSTAPYIKNALGYIADLVNKDTLGVVDSEPDKFMVIMNPTEAKRWAASPEIHDYIKGSYWAKDEIDKGAHPNGKYGLPSNIYGYQILVENAVKTTNKKGASLARSTALADSTVLVVSRPGGIDGLYGAPSFSTLTMFWYQDEMTVETKHEEWDRLTNGRVIENTYEAVTCPASGFLITSTSG